MLKDADIGGLVDALQLIGGHHAHDLAVYQRADVRGNRGRSGVEAGGTDPAVGAGCGGLVLRIAGIVAGIGCAGCCLADLPDDIIVRGEKRIGDSIESTGRGDAWYLAGCTAVELEGAVARDLGNAGRGAGGSGGLRGDHVQGWIGVAVVHLDKLPVGNRGGGVGRIVGNGDDDQHVSLWDAQCLRLLESGTGVDGSTAVLIED